MLNGIVRKEDVHESFDKYIQDMHSNPSILINGDFRNPINQRRQNKYNTNSSGGIYTIDRFIGIFSGESESNGITINTGIKIVFLADSDIY